MMTTLPERARTAAYLFVAYGLLVLANAVYWQQSAGWVDAPDFARAIVRVLGVGVIAMGLLRGARWAWIAGLVFPGLWLLMGVLGLVLVIVSGAIGQDTMVSGYAAFLAVLVAILGSGWAMLLRRDVRDAYRKPAPTPSP